MSEEEVGAKVECPLTGGASFKGNAAAGSGDPGVSVCTASSILGEPVASDCVTSVL